MSQQTKKQQLGVSLIGWIFLMPIILIAIVIIGFIYCELNKTYWDRKVTKMCKEDGGVKIYEKVFLTKDEFKKLGGKGNVMPLSILEKKGNPYFAERITEVINKQDPKVVKRTTKISNAQDGKLLGLSIRYSRIGGDFPTVIGHHSSFGCSDIEGIRLDIEKQVFIIDPNLNDRY